MNTAYKREMARWLGPGRWAKGSSSGHWTDPRRQGAWARGRGSGRWSTAKHKGAWSGLGGIKLSGPTMLLAVGAGVGLYLLLKK